jgi:hypothetical protein
MTETEEQSRPGPAGPYEELEELMLAVGMEINSATKFSLTSQLASSKFEELASSLNTDVPTMELLRKKFIHEFGTPTL